MRNFILGVIGTIMAIVALVTTPGVTHNIEAYEEYDKLSSRKERLKWLANHIIW